MVIGAGEGRSRLALSSSLLIEEGLKRIQYLFPGVLEEKMSFSQDYVSMLGLQKSALSSL